MSRKKTFPNDKRVDKLITIYGHKTIRAWESDVLISHGWTVSEIVVQQLSNKP